MLALPPAKETTATGADEGFYDAKSDAATMDATPLQDYSSEWTKEKAKDAPPVTEEPKTGPEPEGGAGQPDAEASAKEFIEVYDTLQSAGFHMWSGEPLDKYLLNKSVKDRAAHHLAKGLAKMGNPELPWWIGLLICLAPPTFFNWMAAREAVKAAREKEEREAARAANQQRQQSGQVFTASSVTKPSGEVIQMAPDPATHKPAMHAGSCVVCGGPTKVRKGKPGKYCSQSCSGKGRAKKP